jgi:hypothetical protein
VAPVAAFSIFEYLLAADGLVNFEYRIEKLLTFSRRSIVYIHESWGVPEPYNFGVFGIFSVLAVVAFKKLLSSFMGGRPLKQQVGNYRFNQPDFSELGIIYSNIKTINEDLKELKRNRGVGGAAPANNELEAKIDNMQRQIEKVMSVVVQNREIESKITSFEKTLNIILERVGAPNEDSSKLNKTLPSLV